MAIKFYGGHQLNSKAKVYGTRQDFEVIEVDENGDPITDPSSVEPAEPLEMAFLFNPNRTSENGMGFDADVGDFGSDNFMIDFWAYQNNNGSSGEHKVLSMRNSYVSPSQAGAHWSIERKNGNMQFIYYNSSGSNTQVNWPYAQNNKWNHFSVIRSGDVLTLTKYTVEDGESSVTHTLPSDFEFNPVTQTYFSGLALGGGYSKYNGNWETNSSFGGFSGLLADVRIVKGNSVPYSPPIGVAEAITGTSLLTLQNSTDSVVGPTPTTLGQEGLPESNTTGSGVAVSSSVWANNIPDIGPDPRYYKTLATQYVPAPAPAAPVSTDSYYAATALGYPTTSGPSAYNGAVYVYDTSDISTPTLLQAPVQNQYDMYGGGVAFTDTKLIVQQKAGVYPENVKAYVYDKSDLSAAPVVLDPPGGNSDERWAQGFVAGSGDKFAISTKYDRNVGDNVQQGLIYVYDANDPSAEPVKLTSPNAHRFGWDAFAVCMTSDKLIVGTTQRSNRGSVWTYDLNNLSAAPVENISTIADVSNRFGNSISSNGSVIAIGERGAYSSQGVVHIYDVNDLSTPTSTITTGIAASGFGWATDITDTHLFVGVPYDGNNGACYVYDLSDLSAAPIKLEGFDATSGDRFGRSVEAVGGKLFVGSAEDDPSYQSGAVYVYDLSDLSAQATKLQPAGLGNNSEFSYMVSGSE